MAAVGLKVASIVGGFFGALISLKFIDGLSTMQRVTTLAAGTLLAAYCTPLTMEVLALSAKIEGAIGFMGGLFGMAIAGAMMKAIPEWVSAARERIFGKSA